MKLAKTLAVAALTTALTGFASVTPSWAEWKPSKTIEFIVPAGTGGGADWMARQTSPQQQRADELIRTVKSGVAVSETAVSPCLQAQRSIREELQALKTELASLGSALCGDMILVAAHPEIQVLDVSVQRIERVLSRLGANPRR